MPIPVIPPDRLTLLRSYLDETSNKLRSNWITAEWILVQINDVFYLPINGRIRGTNRYTHLDRSGIPNSELQRAFPEGGWRSGSHVVSIPKLIDGGLAVIGRGKWGADDDYPDFASQLMVREQSSELLQSVGLPIPVSNSEVVEDIQKVQQSTSLTDERKCQLVQARVGQGKFREAVKAIESCCRVLRITNMKLLEASHIQAWRLSNDDERLDGHNGLLLAPHIHRLFDLYWVSFDDDGRLLISINADRDCLCQFHVPVDQAFDSGPFSAEQRRYLKVHRDEFFRIQESAE